MVLLVSNLSLSVYQNWVCVEPFLMWKSPGLGIPAVLRSSLLDTVTRKTFDRNLGHFHIRRD